MALTERNYDANFVAFPYYVVYQPSTVAVRSTVYSCRGAMYGFDCVWKLRSCGEDAEDDLCGLEPEPLEKQEGVGGAKGVGVKGDVVDVQLGEVRIQAPLQDICRSIPIDDQEV